MKMKGPLTIIPCDSECSFQRVFTVNGSMVCDRLTISEKAMVRGSLSITEMLKANRISAKSIRAEYLEGALVSRFINISRETMSMGDVVVISLSSNRYVEKVTGSGTIFEAMPVEMNCRHKLSAVVAGGVIPDNPTGEVPPGKFGYICTAGLFPMVKVDSIGFSIEEGDVLVAGPKFCAIPRSAGYTQFAAKVGICLADIEDTDQYAPVLIQPGYLG